MKTKVRLTAAVLLTATVTLAGAASRPVRLGDEGKLVYEMNDRGDRVPDFSSCGYAAGWSDPPTVPIRVVVEAQEADATRRLQAAIDYVAGLPPDAQGVRGAVLLAAGTHTMNGRLWIAASGVVLRGAGADRTTLVAEGIDRSPLVRIAPPVDAEVETEPPLPVEADYIPVGATTLRAPDGHTLKTGDNVLVTRPSTDAWIDALGARADGVGWRAGRCDLRWERKVVAVDEQRVTLDAPLTTALDAEFGGGTIARVRSTGRLRNIGLEDLTLRSAARADAPNDEDHCWHGAVANGVEDFWVRRVRFEGFAGGAVLLREGVRRATVEDCLSLGPVSEIGGYRRQAFFTQGQQTLFLRCWSEEGRQDFAVGHAAAGPNAFVSCYAHRTHGESGPLESWASGVLFDNVRIDGGDLLLANRWSSPPGVGWSAANCVAWQCRAAELHCFNPPTAQNWAIGYWARPRGDGELFGLSEFVRPISLFRQQRLESQGVAAAGRIDPLPFRPEPATNPTLDEAAEFVARSREAEPTFRTIIERRLAKVAAPSAGSAPRVEAVIRFEEPTEPPPRTNPLEIVNGWLTIDGKLVTGSLFRPTWWRGTIRPDDAESFGPSITRYAPGRYGVGLTDELPRVVDWMREQGHVAYDHHYGLWYDRRRDDHLMGRRATADVAPPFYEQPFARSGVGAAWDGLSKYDLTRPNPWYWSRLRRFAELSESAGAVLLHRCYFQHNVLEAGAHWADCPWRPANNVNDTALPEPPHYIGDKRVFFADHFYDPDNAKLRRLHDGYLRTCVDQLAGGANVIHFTSAEYSGPKEFARFRLETVGKHRGDAGSKALIGLSVPKDAQDALLREEATRRLVDVIDVRYWCYVNDGGLYAPPSGKSLAPRQHRRQWKGASGDFESVARSVRECRLAHPQKPVLFSAQVVCPTRAEGWAVLMGGGSMPETPPLPEELLRAIVTMRPEPNERPGRHVLSSPNGERLVYSADEAAELAVPAKAGNDWYSVTWIDHETGATASTASVRAGERLKMPTRVAWLRPER